MHRGADVATDARLLLAIRTIVVTTRVAVAKNRGADGTLRAATARHGVAMLDALGERIGPGARRSVREALDAARRELAELAGAEADATTPIPIEDDHEGAAMPEDLDVRHAGRDS